MAAPSTLYIYPHSLHYALPICLRGDPERDDPVGGAATDHGGSGPERAHRAVADHRLHADHGGGDRKSTRLNSSHVAISYAVFCLQKKKIWFKLELSNLPIAC